MKTTMSEMTNTLIVLPAEYTEELKKRIKKKLEDVATETTQNEMKGTKQ